MAVESLSNIVLIAFAGIAALIGFSVLIMGPNRTRLKIGNLLEIDTQDRRALKQVIDEEVKRGGSPQGALMQEYHAQGLSQSRVSFWFSLVFASIGFAIIALAVAMFLQAPPVTTGGLSESVGKPAFTLVAGTIVDAVAALFFVQSNRARQLMVDFFDKLRVDRKLDEALKLIGEIKDTTVSSRVHAILALNFADVQTNQIILNAMLSGDGSATGEPRPDTSGAASGS